MIMFQTIQAFCPENLREAGTRPHPPTYDRYWIMNMHAVVYNQLQSDRFQNMIQYAFFKSGYEVVECPVKFENVTGVCFPRSLLHSFCDEEDCENMMFLSCAHCNKIMCLNHFLGRVCFH